MEGLVLLPAILVAVWWIAASVLLVPIVAHQQGRSEFGWAVAAILFSPLMALIALAGMPKK